MDDRFYDFATVILAVLGLAAAVVFLLFLGGCGNPSGRESGENGSVETRESAYADRSVDRRIVLETASTGGFSYQGASTDIENAKNPTITVRKGDTVVITLVNGDGMPHDLVLSGYDQSTGSLYSQGSQGSFIFQADRTGEFPYYCSVGSHRRVGMEGTVVVE